MLNRFLWSPLKMFCFRRSQEAILWIFPSQYCKPWLRVYLDLVSLVSLLKIAENFFLKVKSCFGVLLVEGCADLFKISNFRGNFLYSGCYGTVFQICAEHRIDNMNIFKKIVEQAFHKAFPASHITTFVRLGAHGRMGGDMNRTGDHNWPKWHSRLYDIKLSI